MQTCVGCEKQIKDGSGSMCDACAESYRKWSDDNPFEDSDPEPDVVVNVPINGHNILPVDHEIDTKEIELPEGFDLNNEDNHA